MSYRLRKDSIKVAIQDGLPTPVTLAYKAMVDDLEKIFGTTTCGSDADIRVLLDASIGHDEAYRIEITSNGALISGSDDLGVIYGIYAFLSECLNVPPFYKIEGLQLEKRDHVDLEERIIESHPHTRFRGWFINDEDLLGGFRTKGKRDLDYEFYQDVIDPKMMDMLVETAMRMGYNLIVPSTLIDIENEPERSLLDVCRDRGMYISQHHIEPLGVSRFGFERFAKKHGFSTEFSYMRNKEAMIACWKHYAKLWSNYPRVIYQLGLRGGKDVPVWLAENGLGSSNKDRGDYISSAILQEYEIVKEALGHEPLTSSTLWMEGAELMRTHDLHLPKSAIVVMSDIGMSQLFGEDFFVIDREDDIKYGIYYHAAYWHTGPHLAEGVQPKKMEYTNGLLRSSRTDYYSIINVANVKELTHTIYIHSRMIWDDEPDLEKIEDRYVGFYSDDEKTGEKLKKAIGSYYSSLGDIGEEEYELFCGKYNFSYHKYTGLSFPVVSLNDGMVRSIVFVPFDEKPSKCNELKLNLMRRGVEMSDDIIASMKEVQGELSEGYKLGFGEHWLYQSEYWNVLFRAGLEIGLAIKSYKEEAPISKGLIEHYKKAQSEFGKLFPIRKKYYVGEYENWFNDDRKIGIRKLIDILDEEMGKAQAIEKASR